MSTITASEEQKVVEQTPKQLYIGGEWRDGGKGTLQVEDPATGESLCEVADASEEDARAALDAAVQAGADWAQQPPRERGEILRRAFETITERADELALLMTLEMGKTIAESKAEIAYGAEFFRWFSEQTVRINGRYAVAPNGQGRLLTMKQPVGPCLLITPWNFPLAMGTRKIGPAIAAGCTMVVKPAQQTPLSMLMLAKILEEAGLPRRRAQPDHRVVLGRDDGPADRRTRACERCHSPARPRSAASSWSRRRRTSCVSRWSSAATRPSSCSTTPTSTPLSRAR